MIMGQYTEKPLLFLRGRVPDTITAFSGIMTGLPIVFGKKLLFTDLLV